MPHPYYFKSWKSENTFDAIIADNLRKCSISNWLNCKFTVGNVLTLALFLWFTSSEEFPVADSVKIDVSVYKFKSQIADTLQLWISKEDCA